MKTLMRIVLLASLITVSGCQADTPKPPPADWKTECVGRYQVSLPGEVEVASISLSNIIHGEIGTLDPRSLEKYQFKDGSDAPYSLGGHATEEINQADAKVFSKRFKSMKSGLDGTHLFIETPTEHWITQQLDDGIASMYWVGARNYLAYKFVNNRYYYFNYFDYSDPLNPSITNVNSSIKKLNTTLASFHPRTLYELPTQTGVCFPYGYIADDGKTPYNTAVTMRLLAHPDVEIMVSFQIADHNGQGNNPKLMHNYLHQRLGEFWGRRNYTGMYKKIKTSSTQSFMLDGREGAGIFANYQNYTKADTLPPNAYGHRIYNSKDDFGLFASAEGEEGNPAKPTITVYVIRTADRAKGEPVTEAELKAMAETIIASIKPMTAK